MPLRALKTLKRSPHSVASVLFSAVSDSSTHKTPASGHAGAQPGLASDLKAVLAASAWHTMDLLDLQDTMRIIYEYPIIPQIRSAEETIQPCLGRQIDDHGLDIFRA
jgi:hypothetical protein